MTPVYYCDDLITRDVALQLNETIAAKKKAMSQLAVAHSYTPATPLDKSMG